jgi:hypothetical protein
MQNNRHKNIRVYPGKPKLGRKPNNFSLEEFGPRLPKYHKKKLLPKASITKT